MVIIETSVFTRLVSELLSESEYFDLQEALVLKPDLGAIIKNSGGIRKMRWGIEGRGKRSGVRVIYYWKTADDQIFMLYVFPKNTQENLSSSQLQLLSKIVEGWNNE